jgi:hypothetical protein
VQWCLVHTYQYWSSGGTKTTVVWRILTGVGVVVEDGGCCSIMEFGRGRSGGVWCPTEESVSRMGE